MSNPNPFVPKGSLLEQQSKRQSRMKLAVFCVIAVGVLGLVAMLIQGCQRENSANSNPPNTDTNNNSFADTNPPVAEDTNPPVTPTVTNPPTVVNPLPPVNPPETQSSVYVVVNGDTLGKIAKAHGVSLKALEAANPGVNSRKLKIGQKINIPAGGGQMNSTSAMSAPDTSGGEIYVVKKGDNLTKIAHAHGTSIKAIQAANNMNTTAVKIGQKLKIPAKAESTGATPMTTAAPTDNIPAMPAMSAPPTNQ